MIWTPFGDILLVFGQYVGFIALPASYMVNHHVILALSPFYHDFITILSQFYHHFITTLLPCYYGFNAFYLWFEQYMSLCLLVEIR